MFASKWIAPHTVQQNLHLCFYRQFTCRAGQKADMIITAHDYYKLYLNGSYIGQGPAPSYPFRYRYNAFDLTPFLQEGTNLLEVRVYYQGLINRVWVSGDGNAGMIADIHMDGKYAFGTDSRWTYRVDRSFAGGDLLGYDTAYTENRDFTPEQDTPRQAVESACPFTFDDAPFPALDIIKIQPQICTQKGKKQLYDFGREYAGAPIITAHSDRDGARLIIRCGEEIGLDGGVRYDMLCGCKYEETCILKRGENLIEQYDYKGLRYLEIIAESGTEIRTVYLEARRFPAPQKSQELQSDNSALQAVFKLCRHTVLYGAQEQLIDCPTREKGQYLGDAYITGFAYYYLTKDARLLKKALYDFADSVRYSGRFLSVAPCAYQQKIADYDLLYPHLLLKYFELTADTQTLRELTPVCRHILDEYARFENADGMPEDVTEGWNLVDWPAHMRDGYCYSSDSEEEYGLHSVLCAYYVFAHACYEKICAHLHMDDTPRAEELRAAFERTFYNTKAGLYADCRGSNHFSVHANMLPLALGICPPAQRETVARYLLQRGMRCSVYMAYFYLKALCAAGHESDALRMITADGANNWQNMLREGATATFEAWGKEQKWNTSLFHPWACAPILILNEHFPQLLQEGE